ncbi:MAG: hypothetical protein WAP52_00300, partial [Candidatus Sungiibacteriota bacterium]
LITIIMDDEEVKKDTSLSTILIEIAVAVIAFLLVLAFFGSYLRAIYDWYARFLAWAYALWAVIGTGTAVIVTILNIGLVIFIIVTLRKFFKLDAMHPLFIVPGEGPRKVRAVPIEKEVSEEWIEVKKLAASDNPSDWNMAVLRADVMLDDVLQHMGHEGNTVKERLDKVDPTILRSYERVVSAHRLRNMVAHDPTVAHTRETISHALSSFELAFRELGVLKTEAAKEAEKELSTGQT